MPDREFVPDWCLPPGQILAAEMEARGCTAGDIAAGTGFTAELVLNVLDALTPVTPAIAERLQQMWGTPADFWLRLETLWQEHLAAWTLAEAEAQAIENQPNGGGAE